MAWNIMEDDTLLLAIMVGICLLGIGYVAKYAQVAMQGRQIHALQVQLASETARQHTLINEIGQLESPNRIAVAAQKMGMVMGDKADYVTVRSAPKSTITASSTPAFGVTSPSLGIGSIGDN
jgi:cell division protein FtsB